VDYGSWWKSAQALVNNGHVVFLQITEIENNSILGIFTIKT